MLSYILNEFQFSIGCKFIWVEEVEIKNDVMICLVLIVV